MCKEILNNIKMHLKTYEGRYWLVFILLVSIFLYAEVFPNTPMPSEDLKCPQQKNDTSNFLCPPAILPEKFDISNIPGAIYKYAYNKGGFSQVCFENFGTHLFYNNKKDFGNIQTLISLNNMAPEIVELNKPLCKPITTTEEFTFQWSFDANINIYEGQEASAKLSPRVRTYLKEILWFKVFKFIFILLSFGAVCWAWTRGFHLIRYGVFGGHKN